jgi:hypothetical protein
MTKGNMGQAMACISNLVLGILLPKKKYRYIPPARLYFNACPTEAFALLTSTLRDTVGKPESATSSQKSIVEQITKQNSKSIFLCIALAAVFPKASVQCVSGWQHNR